VLTPEQAKAATDALLKERYAERERERNARAKPVPFFYRSDALHRLARWQQAELLETSIREVHRKSVTWGLVAAGAVAFVVLIAFGDYWRTGLASVAAGLSIIVAACCVRFVLVSRELERRLKELARERPREV
jgi:Flp pilus assembly protein TadB